LKKAEEESSQNNVRNPLLRKKNKGIISEQSE
jgi:hypothetical protein